MIHHTLSWSLKKPGKNLSLIAVADISSAIDIEYFSPHNPKNLLKDKYGLKLYGAVFLDIELATLEALKTSNLYSSYTLDIFDKYKDALKNVKQIKPEIIIFENKYVSIEKNKSTSGIRGFAKPLRENGYVGKLIVIHHYDKKELKQLDDTFKELKIEHANSGAYERFNLKKIIQQYV